MGKIEVKLALTKWSEFPLGAEDYKTLTVETPFDTDNASPRITSIAILNAGNEVNMEGAGSYIVDQTLPVLEHGDVDRLTGKLLTYIDATFTDVEQRKAHKDIVRNMLWDWYHERSRRAVDSIK